MRKNRATTLSSNYKIIAVDDEIGIIDSLSIFLNKSGYNFVGLTDPIEALERVKTEHFDLMILDFIMTPIPPLETIKRLDIQGYCEKSDKFDQLLLLIESGLKSISQMNLIKQINDELSNTYTELENAYLESIETLRYTVEAKDPYTSGHSIRVAKYSELIGKYLNLSDQDLKTLHVGGLFHDIGKIGIPDSILLKESSLTNDEYSQIKNHPSIGAHILCNAKIFQNIIPIVKHHHERYDGTGYPSQLKGDDIPYLVRITTIADSFDAMSSKRNYRNELSPEHIIEEIQRNKGTQFDSEIADVFLDILNNHYDEIQRIKDENP